MSEGLDVKLECEVVKIDYTDEKVKIFTKGSDTPIECDFVVVTVPISLL